MPPRQRPGKSPTRTRPTAPAPDLPIAVELDGGAVAHGWRLANGALVAAATDTAAPAAPARHTISLAARASAEICSIFLPAGYPESVRPEYLRFQVYDTLQAACSYLRNILTTSAILRGAGVGADAASPMAAAIAWVLRDGVGMFGSLVFSYAIGGGFDRNVKEWRLFADLINDVGLTLDMLAPLVGPAGGTGFVVVAALGSACKAICGMTAGATRASITAHFALRDNLADVSAKEGAQETAVTLLGLLAGGALASSLGDSALTCWAAFLLLTLLHVWANWRGVGSLALDTINRQRAAILTRRWWNLGGARGVTPGFTPGSAAMLVPTDLEQLTPHSVAAAEVLWGPLREWRRGPRLGAAVHDLVRLDAGVAARLGGGGLGGARDGGARELQQLRRIYGGRGYVLRLRSGRTQIALAPRATGSTALRALLHAAKLAALAEGGGAAGGGDDGGGGGGGGGLSAAEVRALEHSLAATDAEWPAFEAALCSAGWPLPAVRLEGEACRRVALGDEEVWEAQAEAPGVAERASHDD